VGSFRAGATPFVLGWAAMSPTLARWFIFDRGGHSSAWSKPGPLLKTIEGGNAVGMALGTRKQTVRQEILWIAKQELPASAAHPFYSQLHQLLEAE
jgi:hypothetical protein